MLNARDLTLWRGASCLFEDLTCEVQSGSVLLVRGPNGSGKTTLLRVLCGLTRPENGRVEWHGRPIESQRETFGEALAYCGHATGLKGDLTVAQNLSFAARLLGHSRRPWQGCLDALGLGGRAQLEVRYLSAGQKRRASLVHVLISNAPLWIMDEPFSNLDEQGKHYLAQKLSEHLADGGLAVLAAHHELELEHGLVRRLELGEVQ